MLAYALLVIGSLLFAIGDVMFVNPYLMAPGGTLITGSGLYKGTERKMLYVTLDRSDMIKLRSILYQIAPHAFVNILESNEILGEGFRRLPRE